jgi:5-formyltetrahydrofolate cyclo-ligase
MVKSSCCRLDGCAAIISGSVMSLDKSTLRREWLAQRRSLSPADWQQRSDEICQHLRQVPAYIQARTVLAYSSYRQEPDLSPLFDDHAKVWGLPRCVDQHLVWHRFDRRIDTLQTGAFGIWEPSATWPELSASQVDLILVPCVGCAAIGWAMAVGFTIGF